MPTVKYQGQYFAIFLDDQGVEYVQTGDGALIVPLTSRGEVIVCREPAPAFGNEMIFVLPGGEVDPGEHALETANRELQEEIGYRAERLDWLGELHPFAKYLRTRQNIFLARGLQPSHLEGDEDYLIAIDHIPLAQVEEWIAAGRLNDANTIAALFLARAFLIKEAQI